MVEARLTIRPEQMRALSAVPGAPFRAAMVEHLRQHFPEETEKLGEAALLARVEEAEKRARAWRLTSQQDVCRFLNLSMIYGPEFDSDAALPWMRDLLSDADIASPSQRLLVLYAEAIRRLREEGSHER